MGGNWANPFAAGLVLPQAGVTNFVGQNIRVDFADHPTCYVSNWNFSIQREINSNLMAEVAYVGSKATHLFWNRMDNAVDPLNAELRPEPGQGCGESLLWRDPGRYRRVPHGCPEPASTALPAISADSGRPPSVWRFRYNSMTVRIEKRYSKGYTTTIAYTLSKLMASTGESNTWVVGPSDALYNPNYNRSIEANDAPQRLVIAHVWDLPFGRSFAAKKDPASAVLARVVGGWQFSGITVLQSGRPILITGPQNTGIPDFNYTNGRADRLQSGILSNPTLQHWFDTTAFVAAPRYTMPNDSLSQPSLRTPWVNTWNWSFFKNNVIKEHYNIQFRAEFYNIFNHAQFDCRNACTDVTSLTFGQITEGGGNRNIQFGLRLLF